MNNYTLILNGACRLGIKSTFISELIDALKILGNKSYSTLVKKFSMILLTKKNLNQSQCEVNNIFSFHLILFFK